MNKKIIINRALGALLLYVLVFPPVFYGYLISAKISIVNPPAFWFFIILRLIVLGFSVWWLNKVLRPYSKNLLIAFKPGSNFLFDETQHQFEKITIRLVLEIVLSSFLLGVGAFGLVTLLVQLIILLYLV